jgi:hypothetical protein
MSFRKSLTLTLSFIAFSMASSIEAFSMYRMTYPDFDIQVTFDDGTPAHATLLFDRKEERFIANYYGAGWSTFTIGGYDATTGFLITDSKGQAHIDGATETSASLFRRKPYLSVTPDTVAIPELGIQCELSKEGAHLANVPAEFDAGAGELLVRRDFSKIPGMVHIVIPGTYADFVQKHKQPDPNTYCTQIGVPRCIPGSGWCDYSPQN